MRANRKIYTNNSGDKYYIVEYGKNFSKIQFVGYTQLITRHNDFIEIGAVKNPFKPTVYGIGYFGFTSESVTPKRDTEYKYIYEAWKSMLRRCYEHNGKFKRYTENESFVNREWYSFRNFYIWAKSEISNFRPGFELDKDLLGNGIEYNKSNCIFLPKTLNHMIQSQSYNTGLPEGVKLLSTGRYQVNISILKNKINLGTYDSLSYARNVYKIAKEMLLFKRAKFHRDNNDIPEWLYMYILKKGWIVKSVSPIDPDNIYVDVAEINYNRDEFIDNNDRLKMIKYLLTEGTFRDYPNRKSEEKSGGELVGVHLE